MTKEEKIKEAYGSFWLMLSNNIDCEGWCLNKALDEKTDFLDLIDSENIQRDIKQNFQGFLIFRPKSLKGIDDNNGWIKIESEDNLPKEDLQCWLIDEEFGTDIGYFSLSTKKWFVDCEQFPTHYQRIIKPNKPLY